jgi:putative tricarboxylic transport membrane protein
MDESAEHAEAARPRSISRRSVEIAVAVLILALGALVIFDSVRLGSSWGSDGPEAGYFPFYIGLIMCVSSALILAQALFRSSFAHDAVFVDEGALKHVLSMLLPAALFVLAIQLIGFYFASALYVAGFMAWLGRYGALKSLAAGILVSVAAFVTFEIWFQVPLYKGALNPLSFLGY